MCGIAGMVSDDLAAARAAVEYMNRCQLHRGPDDAVVAEVQGMVVGNTRLAINDLSPDGNQPLWSPSGRHCVVFNGEIYNFVELRNRYGLRTANGNDGAVIPLLWERLGPACLEQLRGMFAIAVVDSHDRTLTLARDPFGIKPLAWARTADGMAFASEPRALALATGLHQPSRQALADLFRFGASGADTAPFEGMQLVAPNQWITFDSLGRRTATGSVMDEGVLGAVARPGGPIGQVFARTVEIHLRSDVPVSLLLSGGVDSALLARAARGAGITLDCVTVASNDAQDETRRAAATAGLYRHRHHVVEGRLDSEVLRSFFFAMQRPTVDGLNSFIVTKAIADLGLKVALSGLGGDEALGGYRHFRMLRLLPLLRRFDSIPASAHRVLIDLAERVVPARWEKHVRLLARDGPRGPGELAGLQRELFPGKQVGDLFGVGASSHEPRGDSPEGVSPFIEMVRAEIEGYLQTTLLPDADAFSMANSIELRVPFLDVELFGAVVAESAKPDGHGHKRALVLGAGDDFIRQLASHKKRGFTVPVASLVGSESALLRESLDHDQPLWSWADRDVAIALLRQAPEHRWAARWSFVVANAWLESLARDRTERATGGLR